jgi:dolichol-phosphate mannosyltransferase
MELDLERLYQARFAGISPATKVAVWRRIALWVLRDAVRHRQGQPVRSVLDPACGDGEFLNACAGRGLVLNGCDLRARSPHLSSEVQFQQGAFQRSVFAQGHDLVWISNLLEHLPTPEAVQEFLARCKSALSPQGVITIMGPNIKYCAADYWDFADHLLPLSHLTVFEHLASAGLDVVAVHDRFLPYTFRSRLPTHPWLVQLYLANAWAWPMLGKQFLIRAVLPRQ